MDVTFPAQSEATPPSKPVLQLTPAIVSTIKAVHNEVVGHMGVARTMRRLQNQVQMGSLGQSQCPTRPQVAKFLPKFNKARWPKGMSDSQKKELKRLVRAEALRKMLEALCVLGETGVQMELPGRDGKWVTVTVVPIVAYVSVDNKEAKALTHVKDAYRAMPAFCVQCGL